jgi:asparagine synthase (glutamine-hydrolysing)
MCGINGFYSYSGRRVDDWELHLRRMNDAIVHRGPDDSGVWADPDAGIYFGHQRLSILDLSARGRQPMKGPAGTVITFNGEIYNFRELRETLAVQSFFSESDTEVILHLFEKYGESCLEKMNGMFGFGLWQPVDRKLIIARDRIGIKPVYYSTAGGLFSFSSEIKALLTLPWISAELDNGSFYDFLTFNKVSPPRTMFRGIQKLPPGCHLTVGRAGVGECQTYWEVSPEDFSGRVVEDIQDTLMSELSRAVSYRMISDVPVGAFLSGGVD